MSYLSSKFNFDKTENRIARILTDVKQSVQFLDLTVSNPTLLFQYEYNKIQNTLGEISAFPYTPDPQGLLEARLALITYFKNKGRELNAENFFLTSGTSEAMSFIIKTICDPNSEILVPTPGYPLYDFLFTLENVKPQNYKLAPKKTETSNKLRWEIDFNSLNSSITYKTKAIVIVEPHNPTGSRLSLHDSTTLKKILQKHDLVLIVDEVFSDYYESYYLSDPFSDINCIYLNGLSKMLALPQLKLSWMYLNGDKNFLSEMKSGLEIGSDCYLSVNTPAQKCLPKLLETANDIQDKIKKRISENSNILKDIFLNENSIEYFLPDGGWYLLLKVNTSLNDEEFACQLLEKKYTYVFAGYMFDLENSCWIVISLLTPEDILKEGLHRIIQFLNDSQ